MNLFDPSHAQWWADGLLRASVQGGLVILIALLVLRLLPQIPAAAVVWVWRIVLLKMLVAVVWPLSVEVARGDTVPGIGAVTGRGAMLWPAMILGLSAVGAVLWLTFLGLDWRAAQRLIQSAKPSRRSPIIAKMRQMATSLGLNEVPELYESGRAARPMLINARLVPWPGTRSIIIVPSLLLDQESDSAIGAVLAHELAHLKRRDLSWAWLSTAVGAIFFFHPLVWLAQSQLRRAQDEACDALALQTAPESAADYGRLLLRIACGPRIQSLPEPMAAGVVESFHGLKQRILRLAHPSGPIRLLPLLVIVGLCVAATPTWQLVPPPRPINWDEVLFIGTTDGREVAVPVIIGDGVAADVRLFSTVGEDSSGEVGTPLRIAAPVDGPVDAPSIPEGGQP